MSSLTGFQFLLFPRSLNFCLAFLLSLGEFCLAMGFLLGGKACFLSVALGGSARSLFLLSLPCSLKFRLPLGFVKFPLTSGGFFGCSLFLATFIEALFGQLSVALVLLSEKVLNRGKFPV